MSWLVSMYDNQGNVYWISPKVFTCGRCAVSRAEAEVFSTEGQARAAIAELPSYFSGVESRGLIKFLIVPADSEQKADSPEQRRQADDQQAA